MPDFRAMTRRSFPQWMIRVGSLAAFALVLLLVTGCPSKQEPEPAPRPEAAPVEIIVAVPSSLAPIVTDGARSFESRRRNIKVLVTSGSTGSLASQAIEGAPIDVFLSADPRWMGALMAGGIIEPDAPQPLAGNALCVAVPAASTSTIRDLVDLHGPDFPRIAMGDPAVTPVGSYARDALEERGLWDELKGRMIFAPNARQALDWVVQGEVDAGFLFLSDAKSAGEAVRVLTELPLPRTVYEVARTRRSSHAPEADAFIEYLLGNAFREQLRERGFRVE